MRPSLTVVVVSWVLGLGCSHVEEGVVCMSVRNGSADCHEQFERERRARAQYEVDLSACGAATPAACLEAARWERDHGREREALPRFEQACAAGLADGCCSAGRLVRDGRAAAPDANRARLLLLRGCELGDVNGCWEAARLTPDPVASAELKERACTRGCAGCCAEAGAALVTRDPRRAEQLFRIGCAAQSSEACVALGRLAVGLR